MPQTHENTLKAIMQKPFKWRFYRIVVPIGFHTPFSPQVNAVFVESSSTKEAVIKKVVEDIKIKIVKPMML
jgi:hypothetical protein